jgi:UDP-N-acetylglucosamine--N-acetylmuramyl-(pentapeptide) pyrophosphoryl-undecaprenol N-acetylglucosamine transferase
MAEKRKHSEHSPLRLIISGGGTGGHVFPAIAIANAIKQQRPNAEILFVGALGKMEMEKVPKAGYTIKGLWISGYQRGKLLQNALLPFKVLDSLWRVFWMIRRFAPQAVVGVGGYASGPTLQVANWLGIPTVLLEVNAFPGATNRMLAKKAAKICVTAEGMDKFFDSNKIVLTGNPVRQDLLDLSDKRGQALQYFGFPKDKKIYFLFGGSLGARSMNEAMAASEALIASRLDVQFFWQCGKLYFEEFEKCRTARLANVKLAAFVDRMDLAYAMADVVVSRAGGSIAELAVAGKAAVLVPSPNVAEDHQTANAMKLVEKQAAILVKDADAKQQMVPQALRVLDDADLKAQLCDNIQALAKPFAADSIASIVLEVAQQ